MHYPDLGSDASSVWNFCARFSDVFFAGKPLVASPNVGCFLRLYLDERQDKSGISSCVDDDGVAEMLLNAPIPGL